jgi:hypothetical protein
LAPAGLNFFLGCFCQILLFVHRLWPIGGPTLTCDRAQEKGRRALPTRQV